MPKVFTSESQRKGQVGEDVASRFLLGRGYRIVERNYTVRCGELDIVARKGNRLYFVEVKACVASGESVPGIRPIENMHAGKALRLKRTISCYLRERKVSREWEFCVVLVDLDTARRMAHVRLLENLIL